MNQEPNEARSTDIEGTDSRAKNRSRISVIGVQPMEAKDSALSTVC